MVAVYDFPDWSLGGDDHLVPELVVDHIAGYRSPGRLTGRSRGGVGATGQPLGGPLFLARHGALRLVTRDGGSVRDQQRADRGRATVGGDVWGAEPHPEITTLRSHTSGCCAQP